MKDISRNFESIKGYFLNDRKLLDFINHQPENDCLETIKEKILAIDHTLIYLPDNSFDIAANRIMSLQTEGMLKAGDFALVEEIAGCVSIKENYDLYHFASRYCCFHYPAFFPIYSSSGIRVTQAFAKANELPHYSSYKDYADLIMKFKNQSQLDKLNFLEMNKFIWLYQDRLLESLGLLSRSNPLMLEASVKQE
jgi:hypothetical protein